MNTIKNICVVTNKYPNDYEPNVLVFVQQLVWEFANLGVNCTVICPMPVNIHPKYARMPLSSCEVTDKGFKVTVLRPKYVSLGQTSILGVNPAHISTKSFEICVLNTIKKFKIKPDILYSHFITPAGIATARIGKRLCIPTFMAHGEATTMTIDDFGGAEKVRKELRNLKGVIAVSDHNKKMLSDLNIVPAEKIKVFPNAFNPNRFGKVPKQEARKQFGFSDSDFIVGFVGSFDNRKGILRLEKAIDRIDGVKFACAGKGPLVPTSSKCIWDKPVNHKYLAHFYSACDIFVLPTQMEGCCNAIVEAIACELPIVSSDCLFNYCILDKENSLLIDPDNIDQIEMAVRELHDNPDLRNRLSEGSKKKSYFLTIERRARNILEFMSGEL